MARPWLFIRAPPQVRQLRYTRFIELETLRLLRFVGSPPQVRELEYIQFIELNRLSVPWLKLYMYESAAAGTGIKI